MKIDFLSSKLKKYSMHKTSTILCTYVNRYLLEESVGVSSEMSVTICLGFSDELILGHGVILGIINKIDYSKWKEKKF